MSIGWPDYFRPVQPAITSRRTGQSGDYYATSYSIGSLTATTFTIGTTATGKRWNISKVVVTNGASHLFKVELIDNDVIFWGKWGDVTVVIEFPDPSVRSLDAGDVFKIKVTNYDTVAHTFYIEQHSTTESV